MDTPAGFSQEIPDEAFRIGTGARPLSPRRAPIQRAPRTSRFCGPMGRILEQQFLRLLKLTSLKRKGASSNHRFSGPMLVFFWESVPPRAGKYGSCKM